MLTLSSPEQKRTGVSFTRRLAHKSRLAAKLFDFQTVELTTPIAAGKKADLLFEVVRKQGPSSKQNNVTLEAADVAP